jgi:hypothetical protein
MITRKARFYLVKYTKENGFTGSLVITTTEESAKNIVKEYSSKHKDIKYFYEEMTQN